MDNTDIFEKIYENVLAEKTEPMKEASFDILEKLADDFFKKEEEILGDVK